MFYRLKERYLLRGWEKLPCTVADRWTGRILFISGIGMEALKLCNGKIDLDLPFLSGEVREMIPKLVSEGIIEPCARGEAIRPEQSYRLYPNRYIRSVHWSVTGRCNYRCRHCYMSAPDAKYGELPHETILKIVEELADCGVMSVSLTGGEPLVRKDFPDIVDALLDRGIGIHTIYSNGALISEKFLEQLADRKIRPEINMSFDGVGWHDWLRGVDGAEEAVDRAFRLCREYGFPTGAEMCIHRKNQHTLRESILHLRDVGCRSLKTIPVSDVGAWHANGQGESVSMEELFRLYLDYLSEYYEDGMPLSVMLGGFFSADPENPEEYDIPLYHFPQDPEKHCVCAHARLIMYISPEGRALPCMSLSGMDIQDRFPLIPEIGLRKCLTDSFYMDFINTRSAKILEHNPQCRECAFAGWCHGGCRASGLEGSGQKDLYAADPAACLLFKGGWAKKIMRVMKEIRPEAVSPALADGELRKLIFVSE